jgi:hypothetical protein
MSHSPKAPTAVAMDVGVWAYARSASGPISSARPSAASPMVLP